MLKRLFFLLIVTLILLNGSTLQAQQPISLQQQIDSGQTTSDENDKGLKAISFFANLSGDEKLLYLNREWQSGIILTKDGQKLFFTGRLELLNQTVEVNINGQVWVLSMGFVRLVKIGESIFLPIKKEKLKGLYKDVYAELLFNGNDKLLAFFETEAKTVTRGISISSASETDLIYKERYFLSTDLESFRPLPPRKRLVAELFQNKAQNITAYMKENKLKRNRTDLIRLFDYYEQLQN